MLRKTQHNMNVQFGGFELDSPAGELRKNGIRIKLQEQPFQVLMMLVSHSGALVTRDELRAAIWPADTFVDFDNSLNAAISKVREALGDAADKPRFVETVPRRGYRFIGAVTQNMATGVAPATVVERSRHFLIPVLLLLITGLLAAGVIWRWLRAGHLTDKDMIVLGSFTNWTGDKVFDGTLRQGLSVQLEQSPFLSLVSDEQIHRTLRMMGQTSETPLNPETTREICQRTNSAAALNGSIAQIGNRYEVVLKAVDCATGNLLASTEAQAKDKTSVLDALGTIASKMRGKLGESLATVQKYNVPLVEATTASLDALQFYSLGVQIEAQTGDFANALPFFKKAIERDPNFAMAYWAVGDAYSNLGEGVASAEYERKAFALRSGVSELEKLIIEGDYYYYATGDLINAQRSFELIAKTYLRSGYATDMLAFFSNSFGQYDAALNECSDAVRLDPYNSRSRRHLILTYLLLNKADDALHEAAAARTKALDAHMAAILYALAFYRGDSGEMVKQVTRASGQPAEEDLLLALQADTEAYFGHLRKARELSLRAIRSATQTGEKETAGVYYAVAGLREALFGNYAEAQRQVGNAQKTSAGRDVDYGVGLTYAYAQDETRTQALINALERLFPEDTIVQLNYLPTIRARLAIDRSKPAEAIDVLVKASPYDLGLPAYSDYNWPNLYPIYVRGEAYRAAHQGREAAGEFQKIIDRRGLALNEPIGALAHLQLGRAYAVSGDVAKAKLEYQSFLALWKDADPDIPILSQAKLEFTKLQNR